jgi:hypothetical protein
MAKRRILVTCRHCTKHAPHGACRLCTRCYGKWLDSDRSRAGDGSPVVPTPLDGNLKRISDVKLENMAVYWGLTRILNEDPERVRIRIGISDRTRERYESELNRIGSSHPAIPRACEWLQVEVRVAA